MKCPLLNKMPLVKVFLAIDILPWIVTMSFIFKAFAVTFRADGGKKLVSLNETLLLNSRCGTQAAHVALSG